MLTGHSPLSRSVPLRDRINQLLGYELSIITWMGNRDDKTWKQKWRQNHDCICAWRTTHHNPANFFSWCVMLSDLFSNGAGTDSCPAIRVRLSSACFYVNPTRMKLANGMDTWRSWDFPGLRGQTVCAAQISRAYAVKPTDRFRIFKHTWPGILVCDDNFAPALQPKHAVERFDVVHILQKRHKPSFSCINTGDFFRVVLN